MTVTVRVAGLTGAFGAARATGFGVAFGAGRGVAFGAGFAVFLVVVLPRGFTVFAGPRFVTGLRPAVFGLIVVGALEAGRAGVSGVLIVVGASPLPAAWPAWIAPVIALASAPIADAVSGSVVSAGSVVSDVPVVPPASDPSPAPGSVLAATGSAAGVAVVSVGVAVLVLVVDVSVFRRMYHSTTPRMLIHAHAGKGPIFRVRLPLIPPELPLLFFGGVLVAIRRSHTLQLRVAAG